MNPHTKGAALLVALLLAGTLIMSVASAESARALPGSTLPSPRDEASSTWMGGYGWTFGGRLPAGLTKEIVRFNPGTGAVDVPLNLPTPRRCTAAFSTGSTAYVIGGADATQNLRSIVSVSLASMSVGPDNLLLPSGRNCPAVVWTGTEAYIFGGCCDSTGAYHNRIVKFVPPSTVTTLPLSGGQYGALAKCCNSAVWDPILGKAYLFGGESGTESRQIVEWTKATNTVAVKTTLLPTPRMFASSVWDSEQRVAYLFGGTSGGTYHNAILRYVPATNVLTTLASTLPTGRAMTGAAWSGSHAFVFGGTQGAAGMTDEIVRFNPGNSPPTARAFTATPTGDRVVAFDASASSDPDGEPLTYTWSWGDGTPDGSGVQPTHAFPCIGPYSVRLTVRDPLGAAASRTQSVTPVGTDGADGDGLPACAEAAQGTTDNDPDFDDDGISDLVESTHYADRKTVFCPTPTSPTSACAFPRPLLRDLYIEVDSYDGFALAAADYQAVVNTFAASPLADDIRVVIDTGNLGGGQSLGAGGSVTPYQAHEFQKNPAYFSPLRHGTFHHAVMACSYPGNPAVGGWGYAPGDFFVVYTCGMPAETRRAAFLHELGHNLLGQLYDPAAAPGDPYGECAWADPRVNLRLPGHFNHPGGAWDCDYNGQMDHWMHSSLATEIMYGGTLVAQNDYGAETWQALRLDWGDLGQCVSCNDIDAPAAHVHRGRPGGSFAAAEEGPVAAAPAGLLLVVALLLAAAPACVRRLRRREG